jgi:ABC-2 type transport system ATP-binding protein
MCIIQLDGVTKSYGKHTAVDELNLRVPPGSIYGFIGPNGSGKTTTIRMIMNILYPDKGEVRVFDKVHTGNLPDRVGYLPEERGLYKKMKLRELVGFYGELKQLPHPSREADIWLKRFDLAAWADKKVETLSKGMSQKVQFLIAVINSPDLIILDEPFSGLDPVNAEIIREVILELRDKGATIVFSTHDMTVAESMCDFIFMIYKGHKVLDGTLESIQQKFGQDTIRIKTADGIRALEGLAGIESINDFGQIQELKISPSADPQHILTALTARTSIFKFEVASPSLNDIFIRIARPAKAVDNE